MRASRLRHKITLKKPVEAPDGFGGQVIVWQDVAIRRAEIRPTAGKEGFDKQGESSESEATIVLRYDRALSLLDPTWRIHSDSAIYDIESVVNVKQLNRELQIGVSAFTDI